MLLDLLSLADWVLDIAAGGDNRLSKDVGVLKGGLDFGWLKEVVEFAIQVFIDAFDWGNVVEGLDEWSWLTADWVSEGGFALRDKLGLTADVGGLSLTSLGEGVGILVTALRGGLVSHGYHGGRSRHRSRCWAHCRVN